MIYSGFPKHIKNITLYLTSPLPEYNPVSRLPDGVVEG